MSQNREEVIDKIKGSKNIFTKEEFVYKIIHYYDPEKRYVFVSSKIEPDFMDALVAYIQFECSEFDDSYVIHQIEMAEILRDFYGADDVVDGKDCSLKINMCANWESWCGYASKVQNIQLFWRDGLDKRLKEIIDFKVKHSVY